MTLSPDSRARRTIGGYETLRNSLTDDAAWSIGAQPELVGAEATMEWLQAGCAR
jgi:hypothetical protein